MFYSTFILILLLIGYNPILSVKIGKIKQVFIKSNSSMRYSSNNNCTDCLCDCFNPSLTSSCSGINCFPANHSCQLLDEQSWILESNTMINLASNNFLAIKENTSRLCSCYTPQKLLDYYGQINSTDYPTTRDILSVKYIPDDDSLIVLNATIIRKLSATNISIILRSLSVLTNDSVSILNNGSKIYIAFMLNTSINMYDLNLTLLQTSKSWSSQAGLFGGMFLWNNQILITDRSYSKIWSINSLTQSILTLFYDFSSSMIQSPISLFIYQNQSLYISTLTKNLYLFDLNNSTNKQIISLNVNVITSFMRYDSNCNRLWFGTNDYTYAPVFDLSSNQMNIYQTKGIISKSGIYSIDFDSNYTAFYSDTNGNLRQIYLPDINC
jgi:hypothetical protein